MSVRILIADDEVIERRVLRRKLEKNFGRTVAITEAANGREVLEAFRQSVSLRPQIYILDIEMPGITGLDAAKTIRDDGDREAVIIFLTAFDDFDYARRAIGVHAMDYLLKPCDEKELLSTVEEAIRSVTSGAPSPVPRSVPAEPHPAEPAQLAADESGNGGPDASAAAAKDNRGEMHGQGMSPGTDDEQQITRYDSNGEAYSGWNAAESTESASRQARIRSFIEENYRYDLSVQDMAERLGYSEAYFCKLFKQHFGQSFVSYLTEYRIRQASRMLRETSDSIGDIGRACGYPDPNYFTKVFRRIIGQTPREYRTDTTQP